MAEKETGWTDEFPTSEETFYWMRDKLNHADINVGLLRDRTLLLAEGSTWSKSPRKDYEYLPASPSDAEQLMELRSQCARLEEALRSMALKDGCWCPAGYWWTSPEGKHSLRCLNIQAVLNPKQPEKETQ